MSSAGTYCLHAGRSDMLHVWSTLRRATLAAKRATATHAATRLPSLPPLNASRYDLWAFVTADLGVVKQ